MTRLAQQLFIVLPSCLLTMSLLNAGVDDTKSVFNDSMTSASLHGSEQTVVNEELDSGEHNDVVIRCEEDFSGNYVCTDVKEGLTNNPFVATFLSMKRIPFASLK